MEYRKENAKNKTGQPLKEMEGKGGGAGVAIYHFFLI